jgi:nitroimidazol reductase NimA-like FMN-containing flavoprotein (pyridoxamine 5'-phosphate oxidase superfamily)
MTVTELRRDEIDTILRDAGAGVLSLADGRDTYAVPESFGYDGEHLYFQPVYDDASDKMAFVEATDLATFTVFTERPAESVIVRGRLVPVGDDETILAQRAIAANATIPALNVSPDTPIEELDCTLYRLTPEELSGRRFGPPDGLRDRT